MQLNDIEKLAELSRISLSKEEKESFLFDLKNILAYVDEIKEVADKTPKKEVGELRNVMRGDTLYEKPLATKEEILRNVPDRDGDYVKVKQIF
ncbi:MAG: Asp-tRNA(Asn)/Glu-tRNA(Gln) amidotransferase subunit GatC [Patescibacteria group bacterium]|mgnify:CR=1 FL=1